MDEDFFEFDRTPFDHTCPNCPERGDWELRNYAYSRQTKDGMPLPDYYPERCPPCNRKHCKYTNTKLRMGVLSEYCWKRRGQHAKMITIGLPSSWGDSRTKFSQLQELRQKWKRLRTFLVANHFITGGTYVTEVTQKVTFDGTVRYWDSKEKEYSEHTVGDVDPYGLVKFHAHIHAVVDMPALRGAGLAAFSELGAKFGLGRISVTYAKKGENGWQTVANQAKYLAKYISKDIDCGRQATFGATFIGFKLPKEQIWRDEKLDLSGARQAEA